MPKATAVPNIALDLRRSVHTNAALLSCPPVKIVIVFSELKRPRASKLRCQGDVTSGAQYSPARPRNSQSRFGGARLLSLFARLTQWEPARPR